MPLFRWKCLEPLSAFARSWSAALLGQTGHQPPPREPGGMGGCFRGVSGCALLSATRLRASASTRERPFHWPTRPDAQTTRAGLVRV